MEFQDERHSRDEIQSFHFMVHYYLPFTYTVKH